LRTQKLSKTYQIGDLLDVKVEKIVPRGLGLSFAEKLTIFTPLAAVGDKLRVRLAQIKGKTAFAEIELVLEPSPYRIEPPCQYFGTCGGCDFQQMNYAAQLEAKIAMLRDCLQRIGKINCENELKIVPSPQEFGYRSRTQWHLDTKLKTFGYFRRGSHEVVDVESCLIVTPELQQTLTELRSEMEWENLWSGRVEIEAASADGEVSIYSTEILEPTAELTLNIGGDQYSYSAKSFFQGNQFLIEALIDAAVGGSPGEHALDLYCGVGLFTIPLGKSFNKVTGIEDNELSVEFAQKNAERAKLENIEFVHENVERYIADGDFEGIDLVLLDPPRSGAELATIRQIIDMKPKNISYVSCEPSILARDLRMFLDGGYRIDRMTAFDLLPQTHHVETIVRLTHV
jgi:23S rRNA (uracil1939-C5)-methyltransferase